MGDTIGSGTVDTVEPSVVENESGAIHPARTRIIEAAERCFARFGIGRTRIEDVAREAACARSTVYRYFEDRDALILAVILHDADRFSDAIREFQEGFADPADRLVEGVVHVIELIRSDENLAAWFASPDAIRATSTVSGVSDAIFDTASLYLTPMFEFAQESGRLRPGIDVHDAAEWLVRIVLSLLSVRGRVDRSPHELREYLRTFLVPALLTEP